VRPGRAPPGDTSDRRVAHREAHTISGAYSWPARGLRSGPPSAHTKRGGSHGSCFRVRRCAVCGRLAATVTGHCRQLGAKVGMQWRWSAPRRCRGPWAGPADPKWWAGMLSADIMLRRFSLVLYVLITQDRFSRYDSAAPGRHGVQYWLGAPPFPQGRREHPREAGRTRKSKLPKPNARTPITRRFSCP
jgi:hypothetical protein